MERVSNQGQATTIAGIVLYHPEPGELLRLAASVAGEAAEVVLYCNSPLDDAEEARLRSTIPNLAIVRPEGNRGLGCAYNAFMARATELGAARLLLLDQDSLPSPGMISRLSEVASALSVGGERPAVVGPRPVGADGVPLKLPLVPGRHRGDALRAAFVISSGSLVLVDAAREVGPFREDFFIDAIDIEWCLRAGAAGYSIWVAGGVPMDHRLGRGVIRLPFGIHLADQPARRLYTYLRNQVAMLRLGHVPNGYKLKTLLTMPARLLVHLARNRFSRDYRQAVWHGVLDGAAGRLGPPRR